MSRITDGRAGHILALTASLCLTATAARAQPAASPAAAPATALEPPTPNAVARGRPSLPAATQEEVVVTGSRLKRAGQSRASPITAVSSAEIKAEGATRVEDLLNNLPQVNAGLTSGALGPTGTATVDLRGFGAFRTLVLMNGRRLNPGDPINPSADLNAIPTAMIKRVDVLTGGASSIYGSDAIAGVVNFIMDTNYTGLKLDAQGTLYQYNNDNTALQNLARAAGTDPAHGNRFDGATGELSAIYGTDFAGGAGHVTAYAGLLRSAAIAGSARDYAACNLTENATFFDCIKDDNTNPAFFQDSSGNAYTLDQATGNSFRPYSNAQDGYNTAPFQYLQRPDERYNAGFFAHYTINDAFQPYMEGQFSEDRTTAQYEPSSTALNSFTINCNNPLLSASEAATLCTDAGLAPTDSASVVIGQRSLGGPRALDFTHTSYRGVVGVKGDIGGPWSYDLYGQYGVTDARVTARNDLSLTRLQQALNVVSAGGVPTCQSVLDGSDPACVPYNIFQIGGITPAATRYVSENGTQIGYADQAVVSGAVTGHLGGYGLVSPFAKDDVGIVIGGEYRTQGVQNMPDAAYVTGDLGSTSPQAPISGSYSVYEFFGELNLPLIQNRPFAHNLSISLSDRYAQYSLQGPANAHSIGGEWEPVAGFELRGSSSRAIRAPNAHELFTANSIAKFQASDPCAGVNPVASFAQCAQSGVTAAEYGTIQDTGNFNFLTGGNINLRPETSHSFTFGAVVSPHIIAPFTMSVDYWQIQVDNYDGQYAPNSTLNNCVNSGNPVFCSLVQRDATGSLSLGNGLNSGRVIATNLNTGSFEESGIDLAASYAMPLTRLGLNRAGDLTFRFNGSVALDNVIKPIKGSNAVVFDCTGLFGPTCTGEGPTSPIPSWRHQLRLTWTSPDAYQVSLNWRHIGDLTSELTSSQPHLSGSPSPVDQHIPAYDYLDLEGNIDITPQYNLRLGITNLFDSKPPIVGANANPQILPGNMVASFYDTLGRSVFLGLTVNY